MSCMCKRLKERKTVKLQNNFFLFSRESAPSSAFLKHHFPPLFKGSFYGWLAKVQSTRENELLEYLREFRNNIRRYFGLIVGVSDRFDF